MGRPPHCLAAPQGLRVSRPRHADASRAAPCTGSAGRLPAQQGRGLSFAPHRDAEQGEPSPDSWRLQEHYHWDGALCGVGGTGPSASGLRRSLVPSHLSRRGGGRGSDMESLTRRKPEKAQAHRMLGQFQVQSQVQSFPTGLGMGGLTQDVSREAGPGLILLP